MRASLQDAYGIRLLLDARGRTDPYRTPRELADLVEHLPAGCALGRQIGGAAAWSTEAQLIRELEHTLRMTAWSYAGGKGDKPKPLPFPQAVGEADRKTDELSAKARAHADREARRSRG